MKDAGTYATRMQYAPHGAVAVMTLGNGVVESTLYNTRLQPTEIKTVAAGTELLKLSYGYPANNNGNVASQAIAPLGVTQRYSYL